MITSETPSPFTSPALATEIPNAATASVSIPQSTLPTVASPGRRAA